MRPSWQGGMGSHEAHRQGWTLNTRRQGRGLPSRAGERTRRVVAGDRACDDRGPRGCAGPSRAPLPSVGADRDRFQGFVVWLGGAPRIAIKGSAENTFRDGGRVRW